MSPVSIVIYYLRLKEDSVFLVKFQLCINYNFLYKH